MSSNRRGRDRSRRVEAGRLDAEARARRRERRIYVGAGLVLLVLAVVAAVIVSTGVSSSGGGLSVTPVSPRPAAATSQPLTQSASAELVANTRSANQILRNANIQAKLAQLSGLPVVINQWASWCTNCRAEFPFFQTAGHVYARRVAFVGLDSMDSRANAAAFLRQFPVDYPSVFDPSAAQAQSLGGGQGWPTTIYLNAEHKITFVHVGAYPTLTSLEQDILSYA
jgi:thiol-disulfide isomerase/thioredoxin